MDSIQSLGKYLGEKDADNKDFLNQLNAFSGSVRQIAEAIEWKEEQEKKQREKQEKVEKDQTKKKADAVEKKKTQEEREKAISNRSKAEEPTKKKVTRKKLKKKQKKKQKKNAKHDEKKKKKRKKKRKIKKNKKVHWKNIKYWKNNLKLKIFRQTHNKLLKQNSAQEAKATRSNWTNWFRCPQFKTAERLVFQELWSWTGKNLDS